MEWEDKLAYPSHPEIGAPGAFSVEEMKDFTRMPNKPYSDSSSCTGARPCQFYS
jgi:hypothetical protein